MTENKSSNPTANKKLSTLEKKLLNYAKKRQPVLLYGNDTYGRRDLIKDIHILNGGIDWVWNFTGRGEDYFMSETVETMRKGLRVIDNLRCKDNDSEDKDWYTKLAKRIEDRQTRSLASGTVIWLVAYAYDYTTFPQQFLDLFELVSLDGEVEEGGEMGFVSPPRDYEFILNGEYWRITYKGETINLKDSKGLQYIHYLLEESGNEFFPRELMRGKNKISGPKDENIFGNTDGEQMDGEQQKGQFMEEGLSVGNTEGFAEEILDEGAIKEYKERLYELKRARQDDGLSPVEIAEIDEETAEIAKALGAGLDKRGQSRKVSNPNERARSAVLKAVNKSLDKIKDKENGIPALWKHFDNTLTIGICCSYKPEKSIHWDL